MARFSAVVETESAVTGVAFEGQEIELVAVFVLAVAADRFEIVLWECAGSCARFGGFCFGCGGGGRSV
jgi:hypothetical protein